MAIDFPDSPSNNDTYTVGSKTWVYSSAQNQWLISPTSPAPSSAQYVTLAVDSTLSSERVLTAGTGVTVTDSGANSNVTIATSAILPTVIDAKGDLLVGTGNDAVDNLAVGGTNNHVLVVDSGDATFGVKWQGQQEVIVIPISDETTTITASSTVAKVTFRMPFAMTLTSVRASLTTASTSGLPTFDIKESGTSILSTLITIDANETTSTTAATAPVISDSSLADAAEITLFCTVAGTGAKGAKIYLIGRRT